MFPSIIGQPIAINLLQNAIASDALAPAYLFTGPAGVGKATTAKALAQSLTTSINTLWIEPTYLQQDELVTASVAKSNELVFRYQPQIRIEQIREITQFLAQSPLGASRLGVVVESAELMALAAANAFLKTLEEPGKTATIILSSSRSDLLLPTIVSRCQIIPFKALSKVDIRQILGNEIPDDFISVSEGSPGRALQLWEQFQLIPESLRSLKLEPLSAVLELAREVSCLSIETQQCLADYWQYQSWQLGDIKLIETLETIKFQLNQASSQLVWEANLLSML